MDQTTPLSSAASYYQEETKYSRTTIHRFRSLDYSKKPPQFKDFQSESPINLVPFLPFTHIPFTRTPIPTPSPQPPTPWGLADLSRLLFFSYGVTAIMDSPKIDKTYMRAAPSAGGLYPAEIYLAIWDQPFMADGIYHYQGKEHHLVPVYEGSFREKLNACFLHAPALLDASFLILVSGIYERSSWRYGERGYRRILLDAGHLVANLELMAQETGFMAYPLSGFQDAFLNSLLFLGDQTEVALTGLAMVFEDLSFEPIPCKPFLPSPPPSGLLPAGAPRNGRPLPGPPQALCHRPGSLYPLRGGPSRRRRLRPDRPAGLPVRSPTGPGSSGSRGRRPLGKHLARPAHAPLGPPFFGRTPSL